MDRKKAIIIYLLGTLGQILIVSIVVNILRQAEYRINYTTFTGMICIILGGCSSAIWGTIVSIKYKHISALKIVSDFFNIKKSYSYYGMIFLFLLIDFCSGFFGGNIVVTTWYMPLIICAKAVVFGGIEEIGWRYTFQPIIEERVGFTLSTLTTFWGWGIWHYLYFYIEGTVGQLDVMGFYTGLLTNCFLLAAIFKKSGSLWLCVLTHSLINMLSQIIEGGNEKIALLAKIIIIAVSIFICSKKSGRNNQ